MSRRPLSDEYDPFEDLVGEDGEDFVGDASFVPNSIRELDFDYSVDTREYEEELEVSLGNTVDSILEEEETIDDNFEAEEELEEAVDLIIEEIFNGV